MRELAIIAKIQDVQPIKGKDRIELATVENYTVIVEKGKYRVGDLVVYVFYETVLPVKPEFEFLRARCYNKLYNGFRIRAMKMGGVYSNGIVFPLSILPSNVSVKEGKNVGEILGIVKYAPEDIEEKKNKQTYNPLMKKLMRYKVFRTLFKRKKLVYDYPITVPKSSETNVQKLFDEYKEKYDDEVFYVTEKLEGQSATYMLIGKKREYRVYSHNVMRDPKGNGNWELVGKKLNMKKILKKYKTNYTIQGEIVGPGIQKNIYKFDDMKLYVFKIIETDSGRALSYAEMVMLCHELGLETVPQLETRIGLPNTLEDCLIEADNKSVLNPKVPREGIVYRNTTKSDIGFKVKSREYAVWFESK